MPECRGVGLVVSRLGSQFRAKLLSAGCSVFMLRGGGGNGTGQLLVPREASP